MRDSRKARCVSSQADSNPVIDRGETSNGCGSAVLYSAGSALLYQHPLCKVQPLVQLTNLLLLGRPYLRDLFPEIFDRPAELLVSRSLGVEFFFPQPDPGTDPHHAEPDTTGDRYQTDELEIHDPAPGTRSCKVNLRT